MIRLALLLISDNFNTFENLIFEIVLNANAY
jgi:hypothetical protein